MYNNFTSILINHNDYVIRPAVISINKYDSHKFLKKSYHTGEDAHEFISEKVLINKICDSISNTVPIIGPPDIVVSKNRACHEP